jgi:hypothetical protein
MKISVKITMSRTEKLVSGSLLLHALALVTLQTAVLYDQYMASKKKVMAPIMITMAPRPQTHSSDHQVPLIPAKSAPGVGSPSGPASLSSLLSQAQAISSKGRRAVIRPSEDTSAQSAEEMKKAMLAQLNASAVLPEGKALQWEASKAGTSNTKKQVESLASITATLSKHHEEFCDCYEHALLVDPQLSGHVDFVFAVEGQGSVASAGIEYRGKGSDSAQSNLRGCLDQVSRKLRFPPSFAGQDLKFGLLLRS